MNEFDILADLLKEKRYQLRVEHNHRDMKWYAYFAGKGSAIQLFDEDWHWNMAGDNPTDAIAKLYEYAKDNI